MTVAPSQQWNPTLYEQSHAFVWQYGAELIELLAPQAGERILDLGCGTGQLTAQIGAMGAEMIGLDVSPGMVEQARANYPDLTFTVGDARDFQVEQPVDAVFSNATLHWVLEPNAAIACVYAALKPQGRFVAEFGGTGNVQAELNLWYFPGVSDYTTRLEQQDFEVVYAALYDRPTALAGETGLENWLRMFAGAALAALTPDQQRQVIASVQTQLRPCCWNPQAAHWVADYRRFRVVAYRR
ncbi:MAG: class I SAM-dependent methyltransferase [Elainella sp.]